MDQLQSQHYCPSQYMYVYLGSFSLYICNYASNMDSSKATKYHSKSLLQYVIKITLHIVYRVKWVRVLDEIRYDQGRYVFNLGGLKYCSYCL